MARRVVRHEALQGGFGGGPVIGGEESVVAPVAGAFASPAPLAAERQVAAAADDFKIGDGVAGE